MYCLFNIEDGDITSFVDRMANGLLDSLDNTFASMKTDHWHASESEKVKRVKTINDDLLRTKLYVTISNRLKCLIDERQTKLEDDQVKATEDLSITQVLASAPDKPIPKLPREVISKILSMVPYTMRNQNKWVDSLVSWLPHITIDPSLHLRATINRKIGVKHLVETVAMSHVDFRIVFDGRESANKNNTLFLLQLASRWKELVIEMDNSEELLTSLVMLKDALPHVEKLCIKEHTENYEMRQTTRTKILSDLIRKTESQKLEKIEISMIYMPMLSNFAFIHALTSLKLTRPRTYNDEDDSRYETALLDSLPVLSKLPKLAEFSIELLTWGSPKDNRWVNRSIRQIESTSLRSLSIDGRPKDCLQAYTELFSDCPNIESVAITAYDSLGVLMKELHESFSKSLKRLTIYDSTQDEETELDVTKDDAAMFLPNLECIEVMNGFKDIQRFQRELLQIVRARLNNRKAQRIKRVVIPRKLVDILHQYELSCLIPSFVLKDTPAPNQTPPTYASDDGDDD